MKKLFIITVVLLVSAFSLTACGSKSVQDRISKEIGIDVSTGKEDSNYDTHSGNGDGTSCIVLSFDDDTVLEKIKNNSEWEAFPINETIQTLVYGISDETSSVGPFLNDNKGNPLVPEIQNGYYILIDRQVDKDKATGADILHRYSFNFTLCLYDTDTDTLYFCKLDT